MLTNCGKRPAPTGYSALNSAPRTASASAVVPTLPLPRRPRPVPEPAHAGSDALPEERALRGSGAWVRPPIWPRPRDGCLLMPHRGDTVRQRRLRRHQEAEPLIVAEVVRADVSRNAGRASSSIRRSSWLMRALPKPLRFLLRHCLPHIFPNDNLLSCPYLPSIYSRRRGVLIVPIRLKANSVGVRVPSAVVRARAS